jgi:hypothetical protein
VSSPISPSSIQHKFGWLLRAVVNWWLPKDSTNFVIYFFCAEFQWLKRLDNVLPYHHCPACHLSILYPNVKAAFWLVVVSSHPEKAIEIQGPIALSIFNFFGHSIRHPKR